MLGLDNPIHIAFLLALLLLVFGAKRLPEMGRSLGSGLRGFKESLTGEDVPTAPSTQATNAALMEAPQPIAAREDGRTPDAAVSGTGARASV